MYRSLNTHSEVLLGKNDMRNLRAKIRQLVPLDDCRCNKSRNTKINVMEAKKRIWRNKESLKDHRWDQPILQNRKYYLDQHLGHSNQPKFDKLTAEEIEQICQFKDYYLGQHNIVAFDKFLQDEQEPKHKMVRQTDTHVEHRSIKHKSAHQSISSLPKYHKIVPKECLQKQKQRRTNAFSNYQILKQKEQRKRIQTGENRQDKFLKAQFLKDQALKKYILSLEDSQAKFKKERARVLEKTRLDSENNQIMDLETKLRRVCSFRPRLLRP